MDETDEDLIGQKHYVCLGDCRGVWKNPGVCTMDDCTRVGESLRECTCTDGQHLELSGGNSFQEIEL